MEKIIENKIEIFAQEVTSRVKEQFETKPYTWDETSWLRVYNAMNTTRRAIYSNQLNRGAASTRYIKKSDLDLFQPRLDRILVYLLEDPLMYKLASEWSLEEWKTVNTICAVVQTTIQSPIEDKKRKFDNLTDIEKVSIFVSVGCTCVNKSYSVRHYCSLCKSCSELLVKDVCPLHPSDPVYSKCIYCEENDIENLLCF